MSAGVAFDPEADAGWAPYRWQGRTPEPPPAPDLAAFVAEILKLRVRGGRARGLTLTDLHGPWDSGAERRALVRAIYTTRDSGDVEEAYGLVTAGETAEDLMKACREAAERRRAA